MGNWFSGAKKIVMGQGINTSTDPDRDDLRQLSENTGFTYRQVEQLQERFEELCQQKNETGTSYLLSQDIMTLPEYKVHPLREQIVDVFMRFRCNTNQMEFKDFLDTLSQFRSTTSSKKEKKEEICKNKLKFLFDVYDTNKDGVIDVNDMHSIARLVYPNEDKEDVVFIAETLIKEMDVDGDRKVSFDDFCRTMANIDIDSKVSVPFLNRKI